MLYTLTELSLTLSLLPKTTDEASRKQRITFTQPSLVDELTPFLQFLFAASSCHCFAGSWFAYLLSEVLGSPPLA